MAAHASRMPSCRYRSSAASAIPFEVRTAATPRVSARRHRARLVDSTEQQHCVAQACRRLTFHHAARYAPGREGESLEPTDPQKPQDLRQEVLFYARQSLTDIQTQQAADGRNFRQRAAAAWRSI